MIALIPVPHQSVGEFEFTYDGVSSTASASADWVAAAQTHYLNLSLPKINHLLKPADNLATCLIERLLLIFLRERNHNLPSSNLSLTSFRDPLPPRPADEGDSSRPFSVTNEELLSLQEWISSAQPGVLLQDLYSEIVKAIQTTSTPEMAEMVTLSQELYYYSDFLTSGETGLYPNPFDVLRGVTSQLRETLGEVDGVISLPGQTNHVGYAKSISLTPSQIALADSVLVSLLAELQWARPTTTLDLIIGPDSFNEGEVPLLFTETGLPYELFREDGTPFLFQEPLPVGSEIRVTAFTDRDHLPSQLGTGLDVISAELTGIPQSPCLDLDRNGLDDEWELFFFGQAGEAFADNDNDGYHNLQELLEGTNPTLSSSIPTTAALPLKTPSITISQLANGNLRFETTFPSIYSEKITFALLTQTNLELNFSPVSGAIASDDGNDLYCLDIPVPSDLARFYRFRIQFISP